MQVCLMDFASTHATPDLCGCGDLLAESSESVQQLLSVKLL